MVWKYVGVAIHLKFFILVSLTTKKIAWSVCFTHLSKPCCLKSLSYINVWLAEARDKIYLLGWQQKLFLILLSFVIKTYIFTPHQNCLTKMVLMMGHDICFHWEMKNRISEIFLSGALPVSSTVYEWIGIDFSESKFRISLLKCKWHNIYYHKKIWKLGH